MIKKESEADPHLLATPLSSQASVTEADMLMYDWGTNFLNSLHNSILLQHSSDVFMIIDTAGVIIFVSPSVQYVLGSLPQALIGKRIDAIVQPLKGEVIKDLVDLVQLTAVKQKAEVRILHTNDNWLYFLCTIYPQVPPASTAGLVIQLHDITFLKQAENKLLQHEQQMIFDMLPAMITVKDTFNNLLRVNKMAADFYGLPKCQLEGRSMYDINPLFAAQYHKEDIEIISSGIAKLGVTEKIMESNGEIKWLQVNKIPYYNEKENNAGIIIFAQETTQPGNTNNLRAAIEELKKRNYELDNYFYRVSHDMRAPLCSVLGLINLIQTEQDVQATNLYLGLIERSVKKLDQFIQTIDNHSSTFNLSTHISSIDFQAIISNCLQVIEGAPGEGKPEASVQVHASHDFCSDAASIAIIIKHLISNSLKFTNPSTEQHKLSITVRVTLKKAYIVVEDNGIGIEKKYLHKVFDMFFKANDTYAGAGLGLYVVKQTVEKLGGTIKVKSKVNKGTSFSITLPNLQAC